MNTIFNIIDILSLLVILLTSAGVLLECNGRSPRCTLNWISFLLLGIGAGYGLTQVGQHSEWAVCFHLGVALRCIERAPGPWWGWLTIGTTYPDRRRRAR